MLISCYLIPLDCEDSKPLGMENGKISDEQITSSSDWRDNHGPANGRLNFVASNGRTGSWSSGTNDVNQWLQVDFQRSTIITGISTQGRQDHYQFVKSYTISFSDDEKCFNEYKTGGTLKVRGIIYVRFKKLNDCWVLICFKRKNFKPSCFFHTKLRPSCT